MKTKSYKVELPGWGKVEVVAKHTEGNDYEATARISKIGAKAIEAKGSISDGVLIVNLGLPGSPIKVLEGEVDGDNLHARFVDAAGIVRARFTMESAPMTGLMWRDLGRRAYDFATSKTGIALGLGAGALYYLKKK